MTDTRRCSRHARPRAGRLARSALAAVAPARRRARRCSSDFRLEPARQVPLLRDRRRRHRPGLGPRRHAHPRPGRVLRPRRLRHGACTSSSPTPGPGELPDFMALVRRSTTLPWLWKPFAIPWFALPAIVLRARWLVAALLGLLVFRRRVGARTSRSSRQALAAAFAILLVGQQGTTGGTNGLTNFQGFFGYDLDDPANQRMLYFLAAGGAAASCSPLARQLVQQPLRRAARRGARRRGPGPLPRLRPGHVKLVAFVVAAGHGRARRRAVRADRRHHLPGPCSASCRRSSSSSGSRSAAGPRCSGRCSARSRWPGRRRALSRAVPVRLAVPPGRCCSSWSSAFLPGGIAGLVALLAPASRRADRRRRRDAAESTAARRPTTSRAGRRRPDGADYLEIRGPARSSSTASRPSTAST